MTNRAPTKDEPDDFRCFGGSRSDAWNTTLVGQAVRANWTGNGQSQANQRRKTDATLDALAATAPKDELEAMMAAQLIASHNAAMECHRRAMLEGQTFDGRKENLTQANKLSRTWTMLFEALNKHRGRTH